MTDLEIAQSNLKRATDHRIACQVKFDNARGDEQMAQTKVYEEIRKANAAIPVDRSQRTLTDGGPVTEDHAELRADGQQKAYVVLSQEERNKGFVRPMRDAYRHKTCNAVTTMGRALAETYARDPFFYSGTFCSTCRAHFPVGEDGEFTWLEGDGQELNKVGT